jgi:hypothetical protein
MAVIEVVRWCVVAMSVLVAVVGTPVLWRRWPTYKIENKYVWIAVMVANFAFCYGTAEQLFRGLPGGPRTIVSAFAEFFFLVAVSYHPIEDARRRWRVRRALPRRTRGQP